VLQVVRALYQQLHRSAQDPITIDLDSHLERDLGFDSLARVELLSRLEQQCNVKLDERSLEKIERVGDLLRIRIGVSLPALPELGDMARFTARAPKSSFESPTLAPTRAATLNEVLEWHVRRHPNSQHAVLLGDAEPRTLTYVELWNAARRVAGGLQSEGIGNGATVALMLPTSAEYLFTFFGVLLASAVPVPIYPPTRPSQIEEHVHRHAEILGNASAQALITFREARGIARLLRARVPGLRQVWSVAELLDNGTSQTSQALVKPDSLALLQYTSGSTGSPKGVMLTHSDLLANIRAVGAAAAANSMDVFVSWLPLYHDMGLIGAWLGSLYFGCLLVLMPPTSFLARPQRWLRAIQQYGGTLTASPNFGYELCARRIADAELEGLDLSTLRLAFNGAEPVVPGTLEHFERRFAPYGFQPHAMTPVYGLAEAAVALTFPPHGRGPLIDAVDRKQLADHGRAITVAPDAPGALSFVACGQPLSGYQLRIVDSGGLELPERMEGAVQFAGPSATAGYFHNTEATTRLIRHEWRETGDQGYMASGELFVTGRIKDLIIRRGRHIYPEEIEQAVGQLAGIRKGCVVAFGAIEPVTATEKLIVIAETHHTDPDVRARVKARVMECVIDCIGEPADEVVLARPHSILKTSSGKLRRAATRAAYDERELGRAPASAAIQMTRLRVENVRLTLRRWRHKSGRVIYGVYAWTALVAVALPLWVLLLLAPNRHVAWYRCHRAARRLLRAWRIPFVCRWETTLESSVPHVLVVNHCSYVDSIFLAALLPDPHVFMAKTELQRVPVLRGCLRKIGTVFVNRFDPVQSAPELEHLKAELMKGSSLIIFPEGTFTRIDGLRAFYLGAFQAAVRVGVPVVPVALRGTRSMLRDGQRLPRKVDISAVVRAPLMSDGESDDAFAAAVQLRNQARELILEACGEPDLT
jgi:acyl carrier protein